MRVQQAGDVQGVLLILTRVLSSANREITGLQRQLQVSQATSRELSTLLTAAEAREAELLKLQSDRDPSSG